MAQVKTQQIDFPSNTHTTPGYLAQPDDGGQYPGIVIIQEWWGLVPHIKDVAERFAREGFVVLAPDLYHGQKAGEPDEARKLAMALDRAGAVQEINAAARYLTSLSQVAPKKVGVVGWCMGGGLALSSAAHDGDIGAVVAFYGRPLSAEDSTRIHAPVLGLYGEEDASIPTQDVRTFEGVLAGTRTPHSIHIYPDAGHAFFNDTRPEAYKAEAANDAWKRTLAFFGEHLRR